MASTSPRDKRSNDIVETPKPKKTKHSSNANLLERVIQQHKMNSLKLLERCLRSHKVSDNEYDTLMAEIHHTLQIPFSANVEGDDTATGKDTDDSQYKSKGRKQRGQRGNKNNHSNTDEHNEFCQVCDKGGDLLCCDSCTLVFHVNCVRPKLSGIPKDSWYCAYCISCGEEDGDIKSARKAIRSMKRLGKGLSSDDEEDDTLASVNVVRSGKKFIVRNAIRKDMSELGRYNTLNEVLSSLINPSGDGGTKSSPRSERGGKSSDGELWCTHCIDDPNSLYCCFCGCVYCFGKHDREKLLLCDGCDVENHIYCLDPPLPSIPSGSWYCKTCIKNNKDVESLDNDASKGAAKESNKVKKESVAKKPTPPATVKKTPKNSENSKPKQRTGESTPGSSGFSPHIPATPLSWEPRSPPSKAAEKPTPVLTDILSLEKGLEMIRVHAQSLASLSADDKEYLERLRDWLPLSDLEVFLAALVATKNELEKQF